MLACALFSVSITLAPRQETAPATLVARDWIALAAVDDLRGRRPFRCDAVFARHLLAPGSPPPAPGETVSGERGQSESWGPVEVDEHGAFARGFGWAFAALEVSPEDAGVWMAGLRGAQTLFVNGDAFVGDYYDAYGWRGVPVELRAGRNELYLTLARGAPRLSFSRAPAALFVAGWDVTAPDVAPDRALDVELGARVVNASTTALEGVSLEVRLPITGEWLTPVAPFPLPPLATAKPAVALRAPASEVALEVVLDPRVRGGEAQRAGRCTLSLAPKAAGEPRTETYRSGVDDSVQYFALVPATGAEAKPGLVLTLHGAGVGAGGQAAAYGRYADLVIVAPTNRREFGFDWQDWGRRDAYDVLSRALELTGADTERVYLTGHSMGGHGAWHLAANDPDRWAAVAPSAGWASFDTYGRRPAGELADVWQDADGASRTLELGENLAQIPTFVLHGEADDNVPAEEGRRMLAALEAAGARPASHFQPGAGHWWDGDAAPGADCLTWPAVFELFAHNRRVRDPHEIAFVTVDPGVDAEHHWVRVEQLESYGRPARVRASFELESRRIAIQSENVRRLKLAPPAAWEVREIVVDGFHFAAPDAGEAIELAGYGRAWKDGSITYPNHQGYLEPGPWPERTDPLGRRKRPELSGPFRRAFDRRFVLVYGTRGSELETHTLLARARYDAAMWSYRANGTTAILTDAQFLEPTHADLWRERNVILYGNADTNGAWKSLVPEEAPVQARRGEIRVGPRTFRGDDLACLFVYPNRADPKGLVGVFGDSGVKGARLGYTFQTFVSGVGFPDLAVVEGAVLARGDGGVLAAGFFDAGWNLAGLRFERLE